MAKSVEIESPSVNLFGAGTVVKGEITSNGDFRIDGTLIGTINSKGKVVIGPTGVVEGEIICQNADISGVIKARITVAELLALKSTAQLTGDITTNKLSVEPGAKFSGACSMNGSPSQPEKSPIYESSKEQEAGK